MLIKQQIQTNIYLNHTNNYRMKVDIFNIIFDHLKYKCNYCVIHLFNLFIFYYTQWNVDGRQSYAPPRCPLLAVFCESWQHERQWLSQMRWGQRGWGLEGHPWLPLEWININSAEKNRQEQEVRQNWREKIIYTRMHQWKKMNSGLTLLHSPKK